MQESYLIKTIQAQITSDKISAYLLRIFLKKTRTRHRMGTATAHWKNQEPHNNVSLFKQIYL